MIKFETIGMNDVAKVNPVLKVTTEVANDSFLTDNGIEYLIHNELSGDDSYRDGVKFPAGTYLNGYNLKAFEGQKLVIDEKHITYGSGEDYSDITAGTTLLKIGTDGNLAITATAPTTGVYFKVTDKVTLTGKAVKALVIVADAVAASSN